MLRRFLVNEVAMDVIEYTLLLFLTILCTTAIMVEIQASLSSIWSVAATQSGVPASDKQAGGSKAGGNSRSH